MKKSDRRRPALEKTAMVAVIANALQIVSALAVAYMAAEGMLGGLWHTLLYATVAVVVFGAVMDIRDAFSAYHVAQESDMLEDAYDDMTELNTTLRKQRHDFMNHLQVVYSLIEMDSSKDALEYIEKVYGDIQKVSRTLKTAVPAVNALFAAKVADAEEKGISVTLNVHAAWETCAVSDWELCRVLGNLIDNAVEALEGSKAPALTIELGENVRECTFAITNNGPAIDPESQRELFRAGFTTKQRGSGMGLSIVKDICEGAGGSIAVESDAQRTVFFGSVPKKKNDEVSA